MTARLLMIALDGADGALLDRWSDDGTLPHLAALRAGGRVVRLSAPAGITDDALWASFQFGSGLGEHGRYHWQQRLASGQMGMTFREEADREAFWNTVSRCGMSVGILDVPKCGPPRPLNGLHLVDWLVHGRYFLTPQSYPESLATEVVERFGPAPPSACGVEGSALGDAEVRELVTNLRTSVARKCAAGCHYLASQPWDLFVIGFKEAHCAGHHLWDLADPRHPDSDAPRAARLDDPLRTIFLDLDAAVGALVDAAGRDAAIAVFSTTDMEPNGTLMHLMPDVVRVLNRRLGGGTWARAGRLFRRLIGIPAPPLFELLPYNENAAAVRMHAPRGRLGVTPDEAWRTAMLQGAESLLLGLTDAETGRPVVAGIDRPSSQLPGARATRLPDLLVRSVPGRLPRAIMSPQLGRFEANPPDVRPGNHTSGGLLILRGAPIGNVTGMADLGRLAASVLNVPLGQEMEC